MQRETRLLSDVYARPADDSVRAVCADLLQERGNPHGELIALQLRKPLDGPARRRVDQLLAVHGSQWLGPLRDLLEPSLCTFDRGFLDAASVQHVAGETLEASLREEPWATVRAIDMAWHEVLPVLLRAPVMRSLEHLTTDSLELFRERVALPLKSLTLNVALDPREMASVRALPHLEELGIPGDDVEALHELPWVKRLRSVALNADSHSHPPLADWLHTLRKLPKLETIRFVRGDPEWRITLQRRPASFLVETTRPWWPNLMKCMTPVLEMMVGHVAVERRVSPSPQPAQVKAVARLNSSRITASVQEGVLAPLERGIASSNARWGGSRSH